MKTVNFSDWAGGLDLREPTTIEDNSFPRLKNFFYDENGRLQTRRGVKNFADLLGSPITSYFFHERDDGGGKIAICVSGTEMYKYDGGTWTSIQAGLTEFETGSTVKRTRWDFAVYKNTIWCCNGVDSVYSVSIPGGVATEYAAKPKVRYIEYMQDRMFGFGEDTNPNTLYYSDAAAATGANFNDNSVVVGGDEQGIGTGLFEASQVILAAKSKKIYSINVATPQALPLDTQNGLYSQRALRSVGNSTLYYNDLGINKLFARQGVSGGGALRADTLSEPIFPLLKDNKPEYYNSNCGGFIGELNNYYFSFDTTEEDSPDTTLVWSPVTKAWTQYSIPPAYQYGYYKEDDGEIKYLIASATNGQMYEMETGFEDVGVAISHDLLTKRWDLGSPELWKDCESVDLFGLMSKDGEIDIQIKFDDVTAISAQITNTHLDVTKTAYPVGTKPIGTVPIGGGGSKTIDTFPYMIRIPLLGKGGWRDIQVRQFSNKSNMVWLPIKIALRTAANEFDLFEVAKIA